MISPEEAKELYSQAMESLEEQKQDWINDSILQLDEAIEEYSSRGENFICIKITASHYGYEMRFRNHVELAHLPNASAEECADALDLIGELYESEGWTVSRYRERQSLFDRLFGKEDEGSHSSLAKNAGGTPLWIEMSIEW